MKIIISLGFMLLCGASAHAISVTSIDDFPPRGQTLDFSVVWGETLENDSPVAKVSADGVTVIYAEDKAFNVFMFGTWITRDSLNRDVPHGGYDFNLLFPQFADGTYDRRLCVATIAFNEAFTSGNLITSFLSLPDTEFGVRVVIRDGNTVPDGGATAAPLGLSVAGLVLARRKRW